MSLRTVSLRPGASMIEVMRRFRAQPEARVMKARHIRSDSSISDFWSVQFTGPEPQLADLLHEEVP